MSLKQHFFAGTVFFLTAGALHAQPDADTCDYPTAHTTIHANNIQAGLLNGGDLFWDLTTAQFIPNPLPGEANPSTIRVAGLWIGGVDFIGNLKLATSTDRPGGATDYRAGPLDVSGTTDVLTCSNWNRFFKVKGADIRLFLDDLPNLANDPATAIANYKDIMGWPGRGNPYFADIWGFDLPFTQNGLAAFHDEINDGLYDPLQGDYPVVEAIFTEFVPAEIVWCVFNDQGAGAAHGVSGGTPMQIEVQLTVWAFNCSDQPVLNNTIFTAHRIINRGAESLDSCFIGLWVDFDIGCGSDDYFGSAPDLDAFYAYNSDVDDDTNCPNSFSGPPPVQSVTFLNQSLDQFVYYNEPGFGTPLAATRAPDLPLEYYHYLTGRWRDGSPFTFGGSGFQSGAIETNHAFPDPPNSNGWSMCNENLPFSVHRTLGTTKVEDLGVSHVRRLVTAWTVHPNADLPCNLGGTFDDIAFLHNTFDDDFAGVCSGLTALKELPEASVSVFPNPANESVSIVYGDLPVRAIRLIAADGKVMQSFQNIQPEQTVLNVKGLNSGIYYLQILTEQSSATRLVVIL